MDSNSRLRGRTVSSLGPQPLGRVMHLLLASPVWAQLDQPPIASSRRRPGLCRCRRDPGRWSEHAIEQIAIVRHQNQRAFKFEQALLQNLERGNVEIVGGLVGRSRSRGSSIRLAIRTRAARLPITCLPADPVDRSQIKSGRPRKRRGSHGRDRSPNRCQREGLGADSDRD